MLVWHKNCDTLEVVFSHWHNVAFGDNVSAWDSTTFLQYTRKLQMHLYWHWTNKWTSDSRALRLGHLNNLASLTHSENTWFSCDEVSYIDSVLTVLHTNIFGHWDNIENAEISKADFLQTCRVFSQSYLGAACKKFRNLIMTILQENGENLFSTPISSIFVWDIIIFCHYTFRWHTFVTNFTILPLTLELRNKKFAFSTSAFSNQFTEKQY